MKKAIALIFILSAVVIYFKNREPKLARLCLVKKEELEILASYRTNIDSYTMYTSNRKVYVGENGDVIKECTIKEDNSHCDIIKKNHNYDYINPICTEMEIKI